MLVIFFVAHAAEAADYAATAAAAAEADDDAFNYHLNQIKYIMNYTTTG
jgi:hypothetical protein